MKKLWNLRKWFRNQRIKRKIIIIFIPLISIPLFVLAYVSNHIFTESVINKTTVNVTGESRLIITRIEESILNAENCANIITVSLNKIIPASQELEHDEFTEKKLVTQIVNQLGLDLLFFPDVEAVAFLDMDNQLSASNNLMEDGLQTAFQSGIIQQINKTSGENIWFTMEARDFLTTVKDVPVLTLGKKILNINTGDQLGTLILIIKESSFTSIYQSVEREQERNYFIVDSQGQVISSLNKEVLLKAPEKNIIQSIWLNKKPVTDIIKWKGQQFLVSSMPFEKLNWKLVSQIPLSILTEDNRKITWFIVSLGIFGIVFSFFGAEMLSRVIAKPLIRLTKTMLKVKEGDLKIYFSSNTSDEIGFLASGFNKMLEQIRELIDQVGTEQKQKRHYELALIQSQIKPHFLYNTLDLVYVLCAMNRVAEAKEATKALADFYRIALSGGREVISIGEELDNVNDYLAIQKIRYIDVFDFSIDLDETILHDQILKLTIQPLVENAIYHGLKPKGTNGRLHIMGSCSDHEILITVTDNGVGIDPEISQELLNTKKSNHSNKSFGLINVNERIKLFFGNEYGITIHSIPAEGTSIVVRLPKHTKGEDNYV
ncbi:sensor histidine kinase [Paenibacillus psychroresistens]|uniref:Sensor histidine kinase n=1 Tax=Paenibacillus psychroresistens TaxID=1778678 RepID=A0A6B8RLH1_9BACL|nr:sensor histidine kinase [Paenibacillus psychroresistens]QGQ97241.1 sensor histidine kinase [Paenibacillus psychroresistens]